MTKITDLRSYKESTDFKNIVAQCDNKIETINAKIEAVYEEWTVSNEALHSEHDVQFARKKMYESIMGDVKIKTVGSELFLEDLKEDKESCTNFLKVRVRNEYGTLYSCKMYTDEDLLRLKATDLHFMKSRVDDMIWELEKVPEPEPEEIY